jgi:hypothetical protein
MGAMMVGAEKGAFTVLNNILQLGRNVLLYIISAKEMNGSVKPKPYSFLGVLFCTLNVAFYMCTCTTISPAMCEFSTQVQEKQMKTLTQTFPSKYLDNLESWHTFHSNIYLKVWHVYLYR